VVLRNDGRVPCQVPSSLSLKGRGGAKIRPSGAQASHAGLPFFIGQYNIFLRTSEFEWWYSFFHIRPRSLMTQVRVTRTSALVAVFSPAVPAACLLGVSTRPPPVPLAETLPPPPPPPPHTDRGMPRKNKRCNRASRTTCLWAGRARRPPRPRRAPPRGSRRRGRRATGCTRPRPGHARPPPS